MLWQLSIKGFLFIVPRWAANGGPRGMVSEDKGVGARQTKKGEVHVDLSSLTPTHHFDRRKGKRE
jgi:hypothetical protein